MRINGNDKPESWEQIYQEGTPGWDIAQPAPPLKHLWEQKREWLQQGSMINFGCGMGHDAHFFAGQGFTVTAIDFAPSAIAACSAYMSSTANLSTLQADVMNLPTEYTCSFDYVLEHTCYCAVPRENRRQYMESAYRVLKQDGYLFGLFYRFDPDDLNGPPYTLNMEDLEKSYAGLFNLMTCETPKQSHGRRTNRERLVVLQKI